MSVSIGSVFAAQRNFTGVRYGAFPAHLVSGLAAFGAKYFSKYPSGDLSLGFRESNLRLYCKNHDLIFTEYVSRYRRSRDLFAPPGSSDTAFTRGVAYWLRG